MDQEKIGRLIAECRKAKKMTQNDLANKLGVTDKSVSKWENGRCFPDVSLYKELCNILGITLNEFFAGEKIDDKDYKEKADENLLLALENSSFTLKERIDFFTEKWKKEHRFELIISMIVIILVMFFGFYKDNGLQFIAIIVSPIWSIHQYNTMKAYVENHAYRKNDYK